MLRKIIYSLLAAAVILIAAFFIFAAPRSNSATPASNPSDAVPASGRVLSIVAGENFWGSLAAQLGGTHARVLSLVTDPNADPHEYSSNAATARAVATADYVILNGAGYDSWGDRLLAANPNPRRRLLRVADLLGKKDGDNPHFWYDPDYVNTVATQMKNDLIALDPANAAYYEANYHNLQASLSGYQAQIAQIKQDFGGSPVAATENIFAYLAQAAGLKLISPPAFMAAVAEGNDPSVASIVEFENQLRSGQVKVLVYNRQTVTPLTDNLKKLAVAQGIPIVGITETMPPGATFQSWMNGEVAALRAALNFSSPRP